MKPVALDVLICPQADDRVQLWDLLRDLAPRQGAALLLYVGFQLPQQTVATVLDVPKDSVGRICARALRALRARTGVTRADR